MFPGKRRGISANILPAGTCIPGKMSHEPIDYFVWNSIWPGHNAPVTDAEWTRIKGLYRVSNHRGGYRGSH